MSSKQSVFPEDDTMWNIYRFRRNLQGNLEKVFVRRAKVHRVISGGYRLSQLETANYYGLHILEDLDKIKRLQQTERVRVIFIDTHAGARFHPYFWDRKHPHHHEKFVQVALVKRTLHGLDSWVEIRPSFYSYTIPIVSEGTGESLEDKLDCLEQFTNRDPAAAELKTFIEAAAKGQYNPKPQPDNAKLNLDTEIEHYVAARVAEKLATLKRQDEASLFGEVARLSAELAALKSALTAAFPTINIK